MRTILIFVYILIFILIVYLSINIEKYENMEITKLNGIDIYGNLDIKTTSNKFDNIKKICIKDKCVDIDKIKKLPMEQGVKGQCTKEQCTKICKCPYGVAATGDDCKIHGKETCIKCKKNYKYNPYEKTCTVCEAGTQITKDEHTIEKCCKNTELLNLDNTCRKKICKCDGGYADAENCPDESTQKCVSCKENHYFQNNECKACPEGKYINKDEHQDTTCCERGTHYDNIMEGCMLNECTCNGGYGARGIKCEVHGSEQCDSCYGGNANNHNNYRYAPSVNGNRCIPCNARGISVDDYKYVLSDKHRNTECCLPYTEKYNYINQECEQVVSYNLNTLCREGEYFNYDTEQCECPVGEIFDLEVPQGGICKENT